MDKYRKILMVMASLAVLALCQGCSSYAEKRRAAKAKWEKVSARAKVTVAKDLFREGRYEDARATVRQCLESDPELAEGHLLMGKLFYLDGRLADSYESMTTAVEYDKELDQAWYWLGEIARHNKQPDRALECYDKAINLKPTDTDYIIAVVQTYASLGQYEEALELLEEKIELLPGNIQLKVVAADILQRLGRTAQAVSLYNRALLLDPDNIEIAESLGYCYITDSQWSRAAEMFEKVLASSKGEKEAVCLKMSALCYMNAGEYGKAMAYYDKLSVTQRNNEQLWLEMAQAALGAGAARRASACASKALALRPGWPDAIAIKACAQYLENDYEAALETFGRITASPRLGGFAWLMSGRCLQQLGRRELAARAYEKASGLNPESRLVSLLMKNQ